MIILLVAVHVYRHVSSPFWSKQPIYHTYDVAYWLEKGRVINSGVPLLNRFVRPDTVLVGPVAALSEQDQNGIAKLIRNHYLRTDDVSYLPDAEHVFDYMNKNDCYAARYVMNGKLLGVLTSRVLDAKLPGAANIPIGYVDNLTVVDTHRRKGIAPNLIQTYVYSSRALDPRTLVHLFKREGVASTTHVPLYSFQAAVYDAADLPSRVDTRQNALSARLIDQKDYSALRVFCDKELSDATVAICMQYSDLFLLVSKGRVQIVVCMCKRAIEHFFLIRNTATYDKNKRPMLELFALASDVGCSGYKYLPLVVECLKKTHGDFCLVVERSGKLEDIANRITAQPLNKCPMGFFLYNYACQTVPTAQCFVLY